jgi:hypothetical protein
MIALKESEDGSQCEDQSKGSARGRRRQSVRNGRGGFDSRLGHEPRRQLPSFSGRFALWFHTLGESFSACFAIPLFKGLIRDLAFDEEFRELAALSLAFKGHCLTCYTDEAHQSLKRS